jgi:DNA-binding transcriptional LysR family regulator
MSDARVDATGLTLAQEMKRRVSGKNIIECESFETAVAMASKGLGIAILPTRVALEHVSAGTLEQDFTENALKPFGQHSIAFSVPRFRCDDNVLRSLPQVLGVEAKNVWGEC